jgi:hypothetical protein
MLDSITFYGLGVPKTIFLKSIHNEFLISKFGEKLKKKKKNTL